MDEGVVELQVASSSYEDAFHNHHAYSLDVPHANAEDMVTLKPMEQHAGSKRRLETNEITVQSDAKRFAASDDSKAMLATATNKQWDTMFERLVAYKQKHGVGLA